MMSRVVVSNLDTGIGREALLLTFPFSDVLRPYYTVDVQRILAQPSPRKHLQIVGRLSNGVVVYSGSFSN